MKRIFLLLILSSLTFSLIAQRPDREKYMYFYTQWPKNPLPDVIKTFKVEAVTSDLNIRDAIVAKTSITGYKKMASESKETPDLLIKAEVYPFEYSTPEKTTNTSTTKVDGIQKSVTTYGYKGKMRYKFKIVMTGKNDSIYYNNTIGDDYSLASGFYSSYESAENEYKSNAESAQMEIINSVFNSVSNDLDDKYGYQKYSIIIEAFSIKVNKKCSYDYSDLTSAFDLLNTSFNIIKANDNDTTTFYNTMQPALAKWENALKESNVADKKSRINEDVTCAIYSNIAVTFLLSKKYTEAIEFYNKCLEIDKRFGTASYLKREAASLKERIDNYNMKKKLYK